MAGKKNTNLGNKNAMKFSTPESRKELCRRFCEHIESGLSPECFPDCEPETFKKYAKKYRSDLDPIKIGKAKRLYRKFWEDLGMVGTTEGKNFNAATWIFNMKNRFGWKDRNDVTSGDKPIDLSKAVQIIHAKTN